MDIQKPKMYRDPRYGTAVLVLVAIAAIGGFVISVIFVNGFINSLEKASYLSGECLIYFVLALFFIFISFSGAKFILTARRTIKKIDVKGNTWIFVTFWGECICRTDKQISVNTLSKFSKWDKFSKITSLLSRENDNLELIDKLTGRHYVANGEYFNQNLVMLVANPLSEL